MRDQHIAAIERKIERIQFIKSIGKVIYSLIILTILILIFINLSSILIMQTDALNQINDLRQEIDQKEQTLAEVDKVAVIEDLSPNTTSGGVLTTQELDLVCRVVSAEARGEDLEGQMAVAQVIRDRAEHWDMTVTEVVTAPYQFAKPYKGEISDKTYLAVANVFEGNVRVIDEPITHFHSGDKPYWAEDKINRGSIGRHEFYY